MIIPDRFQHVEGWEEQLRRVGHWHGRLLSVLRAQNGALGKEDFDVVYAYFQASHHLRDWLRNSGAATPFQLEMLWEFSRALRLGEDISNNSKHYVRRGKVRITNRIGFLREYVPTGGRYGERWMVVWDDPDMGQQFYGLEELIEDSWAAWSAFCRPLQLDDHESFRASARLG